MILLLFLARSDRPLISPWETVPPIFFWAYGAAVIILAVFLVSPRADRRLKTILIGAHYLLTASVALVVYKIGYGFDPFIHQATMELIAEKGEVLPKPPYYLGQYAVIVIVSKLTGLAVPLLDKLAVPVLAALLLPGSVRRFLAEEEGAEHSNSIWLTLLFLPVIGFGPFIVTTPQNLSYLFLIFAVLAGYGQRRLALPAIFALTATAIHPLTGIPALAWCAFCAWQTRRHKLSERWAKISGLAIFCFAALGLPIALGLSAGGRLDLGASYWHSLWSSWSMAAAGQQGWSLNFAYFYAYNRGWLIAAAIVAAVIFAYRRRQELYSFAAIETALALAYLASRGLNFSSLIDYEQSAYAGRIPVIMIIFSLPYLLLASKEAIQKIQQEKLAVRTAWLLFAAGLSVASLYAAYPRFDRYYNSRGYSTSAFDIQAVQSVASSATGPYVALANQQVSAAALRELGFDHYFDTAAGPVYAYPIPTGGPLYQYYLDMVYGEPSRAKAAEAAEFAGVKETYLIINKYWYQSGQIINAAKLAADKWWDVSGEDYVFLYRF